MFHITQLHISHFRLSIRIHIILLFSFHIIFICRIIKIIRLLLGSTTRHVQLILIHNITIMRRISFIVILSITFFLRWIYYFTVNTVNALFRVRLNGTEKQTILATNSPVYSLYLGN